MYVLVRFEEENNTYVLFSDIYYLNKADACIAAMEYKEMLNVDLEIRKMICHDE